MSKVYMISDLHLSHKNMILKYRNFADVYLHDRMIIDNWNKTVTKNDKVYLLGDLSLDKNVYDLLSELKGNIHIIGGNHDKASHLSAYSKLPNVVGISGIVKYKGFWLSHAPIHPQELRECRNIHGHIHYNLIRLSSGEVDNRYVNVCADVIDYTPIEFDKILEL